MSNQPAKKDEHGAGAHKPQGGGASHGGASHGGASHGGASHGGGSHGGGSHGGHGHKKHAAHAHEGHSVPPWLMSFGDMMTLFLCFFIILTTMADKQEGGLMAAGLGQFVTALEYHGLDGALTGEQRLQAVNTFRERFGLPPEVESTKNERKLELKDLAQLEELIAKSMRPHAELPLPSVALFPPDSDELSRSALRYLDRVAETLRPKFGQVLVLQGHAIDAGPRFRQDDTELALARAQAVRRYLIDEHEFVPQRVEARTWPDELGTRGSSSNVDARLVEPFRDEAPESGE